MVTSPRLLGPEEVEERRAEAQGIKAQANQFYKEGKAEEASICLFLDLLLYLLDIYLLPQAALQYTAALRLCPPQAAQDRAVLYANRGQMKKVLLSPHPSSSLLIPPHPS